MVNLKRTVTSRGSQTRVMKILQEIPKQVRDDDGHDRKAALPLLITYQYGPCRCTVTTRQLEGEAV